MVCDDGMYYINRFRACRLLSLRDIITLYWNVAKFGFILHENK